MQDKKIQDENVRSVVKETQLGRTTMKKICNLTEARRVYEKLNIIVKQRSKK